MCEKVKRAISAKSINKANTKRENKGSENKIEKVKLKRIF